MAHLSELSVEGLFGLYDHRLTFRRDSPVTIVAGPNGVGKTTLFRMSTALARGVHRDLVGPEFDRLTIATDDAWISAEPVGPPPGGDEHRFLLRFARGNRRAQEHVVSVPNDSRLPRHIQRFDDDHYVDVRDGEMISERELWSRYGAQASLFDDADDGLPSWFEADDWKVDFIETKRLDTLMSASADPVATFGRYGRRSSPPSPIDRYLEVVRDTMEQARRASAQINQSSTRSVAARLLTEYSRKTVKPDPLRARYAAVGEKAATLTKNGLLSDSLDVLPEGALNPTEKRFLDLFLDDFEAKLIPLEPVSAKIDQLRAIIEPKFLNKSLAMGLSGVSFMTEPNDAPVSPAMLSSGEQHELALISRLLFNERPGTSVLIDEPELSLHVGWQHSMVADLQEIAAVADLTFVLATHSTAIINGRWDLVEDLGSLDADEPHQATASPS